MPPSKRRFRFGEGAFIGRLLQSASACFQPDGPFRQVTRAISRKAPGAYSFTAPMLWPVPLLPYWHWQVFGCGGGKTLAYGREQLHLFIWGYSRPFWLSRPQAPLRCISILESRPRIRG